MLRIRTTLMRIRIHIRIPVFTLMRIRIQFLINVMWICDHWFLSIHVSIERLWTSILTLHSLQISALMLIRILVWLSCGPDPAFHSLWLGMWYGTTTNNLSPELNVEKYLFYVATRENWCFWRTNICTLSLGSGQKWIRFSRQNRKLSLFLTS